MNTNLRDKIAGSVYGFAIGDAMGATTEFLTQTQIQKMFGRVANIVGGGWLRLEPGEVTDDTQMTMCVMSAIMRHPTDSKEFEKACAENFVIWLNSSPKDVGGQCLKSICRLRIGEEIPYDEGALGNGSLMRAMPLAILNLPMLNIVQGRLTHNNRYCSNIIMEYTKLLQGYLNHDDKSVTEVIEEYEIYGHMRLCEPSGFIYDTFNNSIMWSCESSFRDAIIKAVNHGGDADTIAAITGSLAGAKYGFNNIPKRWVRVLNKDVKEVLDKFIEFVYDCLQI